MPPKLASFGETRAHAGAALLLFVFTLVLLAEPILRRSTHAFTSADLLQDYALTSWETGDFRRGNRQLCDPALEMQPWLLYSRDELRAGRIPLWNPYNGNGVPHLGNYQSAVFSPFSVPFYVLRFEDALIAAALLRLLVLGFFSYLFLRAIAFGFLPALGAAAAFMLSGKTVMLLAYPHSAVAAFLPAAAFLVERAAQAFEARAPRPVVVRRLAGLALVWAAGVYAGHPEPLPFVTGLAFAWAAWRALGIAGRLGRAAALRFLAAVVLAGLLALALAAPQLLPFFEYLRFSVTSATREPLAQPSLADWWPLLVYPSAVGAPFGELLIAAGLPAPNYEQVNTSYCGATVLLLAGFGLATRWRDSRVRLFALGILVWLVLTCDVAGLGRAWDRTPVLGTTVLLSRSQTVWLFGLAVLAAAGLERLLSEGTARRTWPAALAATIAGGALLCASTWRASAMLDEHLAKAAPAVRDALHSGIVAERLVLGGCTVLAIAAIGAALAVRGRRAKRALAALLVASIVFQNGWPMRGFNPTVPARDVYPTTPAIENLRRFAGDGAVLALTDNNLLPDTNLVYRVRMPQSYDALGVRRFEGLQTLIFNARGAWRTPRRATPRALQVFGIEHVITAGDWVPIGSGLWNYGLNRGSTFQPIVLRPGIEVEQSFVADRDGLDSVSVLASTLRFSEALGYDLRLRLYDEGGRLVAERTWDAEQLRTAALHARDIAFSGWPFAPTRAVLSKYATLCFEPLADSRLRVYRLVADSTESRGENSVILWHSIKNPYRRHRLRINAEVRDAMLLFDFRANSAMFEKVAALGRLSLQRFHGGLGSFFAVPTAIRCDDFAQAATLVADPKFDPYRAVVLERDGSRPTPLLFPSNAGTSPERRVRSPLEDVANVPAIPVPRAEDERATRAEIVSRTPGEVRLRVARRDGGWLVACQTWFPGWRATVNGAERPVEVGNFAFQAVELDRGENDVVLRYEPASWRWGLWIALGALAAATAGAWLALRRPRSGGVARARAVE